jgi:WD40 repeat protein
MSLGNFRITSLWIGGSAEGFLMGAVLAGTAFPGPPIYPGAMEGIKNQYDLREAAHAFTVAVPFAVSQWLVLRYVLAIHEVPGKAKSVLWIAVTSIGIAAMMFLMPIGLPMLFLPMILEPMLPGIVFLSLGQWFVLRLLIKARFFWALLTIVGAVLGTYLAVMASLTAGVMGWGLVFGGCIGTFQATVLTAEFSADLKHRGGTTRIRNSRREIIASIGLALVVIAALAPSLLFTPDYRSVNSVAYSPDGRRIAADVENFVYVWDVETGNLIFGIDSGQGQRIWNPGEDLAFSADGSRIAIAPHGPGAVLLDSETGERLLTIRDYPTSHGVGDIAFSPDGRQVFLTLVDGNVALYDAIDGQFVAGFKSTIESNINTPSVRSASFSPDGTRVAAGGNYWPVRGPPEGYAVVWDVATRQELLVLTGHATPVWDLAFSADSSRIMTRGGETVRVWDAHDGAALLTLRPECSGIVDAAFMSDDSQIMVGCEDSTMYACETANGQCTSVFSRPLSEMDQVVTMSVHPDGVHVVMSTFAGTVETWNTRTGKRIRKFKMPDPVAR